MIMTDLRELKTLLDIDSGDTSEDKKINFLVTTASHWIEELLGRDFTYKTRTLPYRGYGTQKLVLRHRPVYPAPPTPYSALTVYVDDYANWGTSPNAFQNSPGASPLIYGKQYSLQIDQDDGSSRSAILWRINAYWPRPTQRQEGLLTPFKGPDPGSIQVTYTAGWTVDTLPDSFRMGTNLLVMKLLDICPLGQEISSESYEERSISRITSEKSKLLLQVQPFIRGWHNWVF